MNTIPRHRALVPACPYTLAVSLAIADVEKRLQGSVRYSPLRQRFCAPLL